MSKKMSVLEAFAKIGVKPSHHSYAHEKWKRQEQLRFDELQMKLKRKGRRNPMLVGSDSVKSGAKNFGHATAGALGSVLINRFFTDSLPSKWHIPTHALLSAGTLFLPFPGLGGAMFYALISETYYGIIRKRILESAKIT